MPPECALISLAKYCASGLAASVAWTSIVCGRAGAELPALFCVPPPVGPAWPDFLVRFESAYAAELAAFVAVAHGDAPSPCTAHDGVASLRIAEAASRSLHEHRPVQLAEIPG